jgi:hypothetical protein
MSTRDTADEAMTSTGARLLRDLERALLALRGGDEIEARRITAEALGAVGDEDVRATPLKRRDGAGRRQRRTVAVESANRLAGLRGR